uniref:GRAM domain-containing protein 4-like n=1 Tax=Gouania willdenowi TaxID=441366 RepID=A0A8C5HQE4_GOUWI
MHKIITISLGVCIGKDVAIRYVSQYLGRDTILLRYIMIFYPRPHLSSSFTMLRRLDKYRFRSSRREEFQDSADSPNTSDNESHEDVTSTFRPYTRETEDFRDVDGEQQNEAQVQEKEELRKLKEESNVDFLRQELERERSKRTELEQKYNEALRSSGTGECAYNLRESKESNQCSSSFLICTCSDKQADTLFDRFMKWVYEHYGVYIEDFRFQPEEVTVETEEPLSAKRLTENMRRLKRELRPVNNFKKNLSALSSWYSVYTSAIAFIVYMYGVWHGWTISMFLFLAILRLSLNYLISRGWRIQWSIVPEVWEPVEPPKEDLTVSEKFTLVLDVAQKAQNILGKMANILEKIKNLFMWVEPELTQKLYVGLWVAFVSSCLLPFRLLGLLIGVYAGIKFFIINFIFKSCPKLRQRYDTPYVVWTNLPTDLQLKERGGTTLSRRVSSTSVTAAAPLGAGRDEDGGRYYSTKRGAFHEVFNLPESEQPLLVCENGWRCCLINRDKKTPTDYIRNGVLYVTENYLCFEVSSSRSISKRNKVIRLQDIIDIQKYKVLSVLPGSGMGISIATPFTQKPLVFGAMMHRDESFDAIFSQYAKVNSMTAATEPEL